MSLIVPSFNGEFIFGTNVVMTTSDVHRAIQVNAFLGVNGIEVLDHGARERHTDVSGRFEAADESSLGILENIVRTYKNPYAYTLVTTDGLTWRDVKLDTFKPVPKMQIDIYTGIVFRNYHARFIHLRT